ACVATAPTSASAHNTPLPTEKTRDCTAAPISLVFGSTPRMENVATGFHGIVEDAGFDWEAAWLTNIVTTDNATRAAMNNRRIVRPFRFLLSAQGRDEDAEKTLHHGGHGGHRGNSLDRFMSSNKFGESTLVFPQPAALFVRFRHPYTARV